MISAKKAGYIAMLADYRLIEDNNKDVLENIDKQVIDCANRGLNYVRFDYSYKDKRDFNERSLERYLESKGYRVNFILCSTHVTIELSWDICKCEEELELKHKGFTAAEAKEMLKRIKDNYDPEAVVKALREKGILLNVKNNTY